MIRQARIRDKSREMTGTVEPKHSWWLVAGGRRGKDDRKQNTLAPLARPKHFVLISKVKIFSEFSKNATVASFPYRQFSERYLSSKIDANCTRTGSLLD
jgi:hypothetical protein